MNTNYKLTYHYKQDNKIDLAITDLALLLFLYDQSLLSQQQLFRYYTLISEFKSDSAFRRKMSKWHNAGIIKKTKKNIVNGYQLALLSITEAGLDLIKAVGLVPKQVNRKYISKTNIDHTLSIKEAFINFITTELSYEAFYVSDRENVCIPIHQDFHLYYELEGEDIYYKQDGILNKQYEFIEFKSIVEQSKLKVNNLEQSPFEKLKPDLSLNYLGKTMFIEVDTGSESIGDIHSENVNTISGKIKRYNELNIQDVSLVFLVLDNEQSLKSLRGYPSRSQRIRNMKLAITNIVPTNDDMLVYVLPFSRSSFRILAFKQAYNFEDIVSSNEKIKQAIISRVLSNILSDDWTEIREKYINLGKPDTMLSSPTTDENVIVLFLEEGNCEHFEKLESYLYKMKKGIISANSYLLLIYSKTEEMYKDIILSREALNNSYFRNRIVKTNINDLKIENTKLLNYKNEVISLLEK